VSRGAFRGTALLVLAFALGCSDAAAPLPLVACRLTSTWVQPDGVVARVSSCYDVCPDDAADFAAAHAMTLARVASCQ
jgi:hypothetical protein